MEHKIGLEEGEKSGQWGKRRTHMRHAVSVPAIIVGSRGAPISGEIQDVGSNGMFVHYEDLVPDGGPEPLKVGTRVSIRFAPEIEGETGQLVAVTGQIMRRLPHGIGLQLLDLNDAQKAALRIIATAAVRERARSEAAQPGGPEPTGGGRQLNVTLIMRACRKVLQQHLPNLIWTLRTETVSRLRLGAEGKPKPQQDDRAADAALLESKGNLIGLTVERLVMMGFAEIGGLENTQELVYVNPQSATSAESGEGKAALDVLGNEAMDDFTAIATVIQRVEDKIKSKSFVLNLRLAYLLGHRVETDRNPLVPAVICKIFWKAMTDYGGTGEMRRCLKEVMTSRMIQLLNDVYDDIDAVLDKHHVPHAFEPD